MPGKKKKKWRMSNANKKPATENENKPANTQCIQHDVMKRNAHAEHNTDQNAVSKQQIQYSGAKQKSQVTKVVDERRDDAKQQERHSEKKTNNQKTLIVLNENKVVRNQQKQCKQESRKDQITTTARKNEAGGNDGIKHNEENLAISVDESLKNNESSSQGRMHCTDVTHKFNQVINGKSESPGFSTQNENLVFGDFLQASVTTSVPSIAHTIHDANPQAQLKSNAISDAGSLHHLGMPMPPSIKTGSSHILHPFPVQMPPVDIAAVHKSHNKIFFDSPTVTNKRMLAGTPMHWTRMVTANGNHIVPMDQKAIPPYTNILLHPIHVPSVNSPQYVVGNIVPQTGSSLHPLSVMHVGGLHGTNKVVPLSTVLTTNKSSTISAEQDVNVPLENGTVNTIVQNGIPTNSSSSQDIIECSYPPVSAQVEADLGGDSSAEEDDTMCDTPAAKVELAEFKENLISLVKKNGGKIAFSDLCNQFRVAFGKNIRRWFKHTKVTKVADFFQEYCSDVFYMDNSSKKNDMMVYEFGKGPKTTAFNNQLKSMSSAAAERQLQQTVALMQGTSKLRPIEIEDEDNDDDEDDLLPSGLVSEKVSEKFTHYREFQMLHVAYCKLRIVAMFHNHGQDHIPLHNFPAFFQTLYRENFFRKPVLKYYISLDGVKSKSASVSNFLKRFCADFVKVEEEAVVEINGDLAKLFAKFYQQVLSGLENLNGICGKLPDPVPKEMELLGNVADDGKFVDVARVPSHHGSYSLITEFPKVGDHYLQGRGRPTLDELNERVIQIRNKMCRDGRLVRITEILAELCSFYKVSSVRDLNPLNHRSLRRDTDIPAIYDISRIQGKVNAFIQAFVQFRNVCTLHELEEELCKMESKSAFADLKLGPLQKQILVYELFQFPPTKECIPTITTLEVFRLLWKLLHAQHSKKTNDANKERDRISLQQFMEYLIDQHGFSDPFESGVKIGSIALAIQVVRKAWFGDMNHHRATVDKFKKQLCSDLEQHLIYAANSMFGQGTGLLKQISGMRLLDGFTVMYDMLQRMKIEACKKLPGTANLINFSDITMNALTIIQKDALMSRIFHLLLSTAPLKALGKDDITILNYLGFKNAIDHLTVGEGPSKKVTTQKPHVTPKGKILETCKRWLSKLSDGDVATLAHVEKQIAAEINSQHRSFNELGHGSFLEFVAADEELLNLVDINLSIKSTSSSQSVTKEEFAEFVQQCETTNGKDDVRTALKLQFDIGDLGEQLNTVIDNNLHNKVVTKESCVKYLHAILCGSEYHNNTIAMSVDQTLVDRARTKIQAAPYLVDVDEWVQWNVLFQHKLGNLKNFLCEQFSDSAHDFTFIEKSGKRFLKVLKISSTDDFLCALKSKDWLMMSLSLVSMVCSYGDASTLPVALLSNHVQNVFLTSNQDEILPFTLHCFQLIPFELLCCYIDKIFLEPLSKVFGRLKVPELLLTAATKEDRGREILHALGFHLSVREWMEDYDQLLQQDKQHQDEKNKLLSKHLEEGEIPDDDEEKEAIPIKPESKDEEMETTPASLHHHVAGTMPEDATEQQFVEPVSENAIESGESTVLPCGENTECKQFIEDIRREQFGIGEVFGEKEQKLIDIHREREGRSLHRLSKELYTKDSHFVLELIQNADDNEYSTSMMEGRLEEVPTIVFIVEAHQITILNNEIGFKGKNIKALCDVGKSTKGMHRKGYIGQKGIGFKSVFRVTDCPEIHSNGYHIKFDASTGPNGYILPQWVEDNPQVKYLPPSGDVFTWNTMIILPLKAESQDSKLTSRFHDIHPSLLLFLNRLQKIVIEDKVSGIRKIMRKQKVDDNLIRLNENDETSLWFVVDNDISVANLRPDIDSTTVSTAFPLQMDESSRSEVLPVQPVFAFLPLRSYGFKFIIQADFEVPSSREDIDKDSPWNQCILQRLPTLIVAAFHVFKNHDHFNNLDGVVQYFRFMDLEDHVLGVFKQVARQILKLLLNEPCIPVRTAVQETCSWAIPNSVVLSKREIESVISPAILHRHLGLQYVCKEVANRINNSVYRSLGVRNLSLNQLLDIAGAVANGGSSDVQELQVWFGKWLYAVYVSLQDTCDYGCKTLDAIRALKVFGLCDGTFVSLKDHVVFFPMDQTSKKANKALTVIEADLNMLSHETLSCLNEIERQQVVRLLQDLGVKSMSPADLISNYVIPLFKTEGWKEKSEKLVVASLVYLRQQFSLGLDALDFQEVKQYIVVLTNKGLKNPSLHPVYIPPEYGNKINLKQVLPACDWTLVSNQYFHSDVSKDVNAWSEFWTLLELKAFAGVQKCERKLHQSDLVDSVWSKYSETWERTEDDTYVIHDLYCPELEKVTESSDMKQICVFALMVDKYWDANFKRFDLGKQNCAVKSTSGHALPYQTYSSCLLKMRSSSWLLAAGHEMELCVPRDLFLPNENTESLLADKVKYLSTQFKNQDFITTVGVYTELSFGNFLVEFEKWREESHFSTTYAHTQQIYDYLKSMVTSHPNEVESLLQTKLFFLTSNGCGNQKFVEGKFYHKSEVYWEDPSGVIFRSSGTLSQRRTLKGYYLQKMQDFFVRTLGVDLHPNVTEYFNAVTNISSRTTLPDKQACLEIYTLFAVLGQRSMLDNCDDLDWSFPTNVTEQVSLYADLQEYVNPKFSEYVGQHCDKIFPTHLNQFASLQDQPILVLDDDLASIYKKDENAPMIFVKDITRMLKSGGQSKRNEKRDLEKKMIRIFTFLKACRVPLLKDLIEQPEVVPEQINMGCEKWQLIMHQIAPFIQRFLRHKHEALYKRLQDENFSTYLKESKFFEVQDLQVIYRLKGRHNVNIKLSKSCNVDKSITSGAYIYVTKAHVEDASKREIILKDLMELFTDRVESLKEELLDLVVFFSSVNDKESYMQRKRIPSLPNDETAWEFPKPEEIIKPAPKPKADPVVEPVQKGEDNEARLTCWPPRKPGSSGKQPKPESVRKDEREILEKWKPPEAPSTDFLKKNESQTVEESDMEASKRKAQGTSPREAPHKRDEGEQKKDANMENRQLTGADQLKDSTTDGARISETLKRKRLTSETSTSVPAENKSSDVSSIPVQKRPFTPVSPMNEIEESNDDRNKSWIPPSFQDVDANLLVDRYEDLPISINREAQEGVINFAHNKDSNKNGDNLIGEIGERLVYEHLCSVYKDEIADGRVFVSWMNKDEETGEPYDIKISYADNLNMKPIYVEVKSTYLDERREFEISSQQLKFAFEKTSCFHLYRLSGLSDQKQLKLRRLVNLATYMDNKSVRLFMIL